MSAPPYNSPLTTHGGIGAVWRTFVNTTSLLTSDVVNRAAVFAVYIMVGRFCGARSFGQLSLGLTLLYTFQVFAGVGLPTLITREIAKRPALAGRYLANAGVIVVGAFVVSLAALVLLIVASRYPADTSVIILLLGLGILPWSLTTLTEAVLRAWERMHLLLLFNGPVNLIKVGLIYYLLSSGYGVPAVAVVFLVCQFGLLLLELAVVLRHVDLRDIAISTSFCQELMSRAWKFMGIDSLIALWGSINTVLLSWFVGEAAVGVFGAAWQLLMPVRLATQSIVNSLFPMLSRCAEESRTQFQQLTVLLTEVLVIITVPSCILLYFGALSIISLVYGSGDFASSVLVLRIMLPVLIFQAATATLGQALYSRRHEQRTLRIVAIGVVSSVISGVVLIYAYGVVGAAVSSVLTSLLNVYLHYVASRDCLKDDDGRPVRWRSTLIVQAIAAGAVMAGVQASLGQLSFVWSSIIASLSYLIALGLLVFAACRGTRTIRERFLLPLHEHRDVSAIFRNSHGEDSLCPETVATSA